jgi:hypothetical protein
MYFLAIKASQPGARNDNSICRTKRIFANSDSLGHFHRFLNSPKHIPLRDLPDLNVFFLCAAKGGFDLSHQKNICQD